MGAPLNSYGERLTGLSYRPRDGAYALIARDGLIALVRHGGKLDLPGGGMDPGETPEDAVVRECREETGFAVRTGALIGEVVQYFLNDGDAPVANHARIFEADILSEHPETKVEMDHETVWLTPQAVLLGLEKEGYAAVVLSWMRRQAS